MKSRPILASFMAPIGASVPLAIVYVAFVLLPGRSLNAPEGSFPIFLIGLFPLYAASCIFAFIVGKLFIRLGLTSLRWFLSVAVWLAIMLAAVWVTSTEGMHGASLFTYIAGIAICSGVLASCSAVGAFVWWVLAVKHGSYGHGVLTQK